MTKADNWALIERHGLLPVSKLAEMSTMPDGGAPILRRRRNTPLRLPIAGGEAWVRDQGPIREQMLTRCLRGIPLEEWYAMLNERVFFFVRRADERKLCNAYRTMDQCLVRIDGTALVNEYGRSAFVSRFNSGSVPRSPAIPRGPEIYVSASEVGRSIRPREIRELTIVGGVPNLADFVLSVDVIRATS